MMDAAPRGLYQIRQSGVGGSLAIVSGLGNRQLETSLGQRNTLAVRSLPAT